MSSKWSKKPMAPQRQRDINASAGASTSIEEDLERAFSDMYGEANSTSSPVSSGSNPGNNNKRKKRKTKVENLNTGSSGVEVNAVEQERLRQQRINDHYARIQDDSAIPMDTDSVKNRFKALDNELEESSLSSASANPGPGPDPDVERINLEERNRRMYGNQKEPKLWPTNPDYNPYVKPKPQEMIDTYVNEIKTQSQKIGDPSYFKPIVESDLVYDTSKYANNPVKQMEMEQRNRILRSAETYDDLMLKDKLRYKRALNKRAKGLEKDYEQIQSIVNAADNGQINLKSAIKNIAEEGEYIDPEKVKSFAKTLEVNTKNTAMAAKLSQTEVGAADGLGAWAKAHPLGTAMMVVAGVSLFKRLTDDDD